MNETIPTNEDGAEKFPNEREVLNLFEEIIGENFEIFRSLEDENGVYMLEVRATDESGDLVQYNYIRAGKYPEGSSLETVIDVIFYSGDMPVGGHPLKKYTDGQWVDEN